MQHKKKTAAELFGVAPRPKAIGRYVVDPGIAVAPFAHDDAVIRVFCHACGRYIGITQEGAGALAKEFGIRLPDILSGSYFEASQCVSCSDERKFTDFVLKHI